MKEFFGVFKTHVKRGILSPMFLICTALCTALMIILVFDSYSTPPMTYYVYGERDGLNYFLDRVRGRTHDYFRMMIICFPAVMLFYEDWKSGNFKLIINRCGRAKYTFATILSAGVTAAAVTIISYLIFSAFILTKYPLVPIIENQQQFRVSIIGFPNAGLLYTGHEVLCYALYILSQGARSAFYAAIALFQSMIITNKHLTAISPVLLYISYFALNFALFLPELLDPYMLFWNGFRLYIIFGGTQDGSLFSPIAAAYPFIYCAVMLTALALIGTKILRVKMNRSI